MNLIPDPHQTFSVWYQENRHKVEKPISPHTFKGLYAKTLNQRTIQSLFQQWMHMRQDLGLAAPDGTALDR